MGPCGVAALHAGGRAFVRASGTEVCVNRTQALVNRTQVLVNRTQALVNRTQDVVRVYAEAATQGAADELAAAVARHVHGICGGVGPTP